MDAIYDDLAASRMGVEEKGQVYTDHFEVVLIIEVS